MIKKILLGLLFAGFLCTNIAHAEAPILAADPRASIVDSYYKSKGMPLEGQGKSMVETADRYGLDWRLLPAISIQESTGGKHMCKNNPYGYGSCRITFSGISLATDTVGKALGGFNPKLKVYKAPTTERKLYYYNGTVMQSYPKEVMAIMEKIGPKTITR